MINTGAPPCDALSASATSVAPTTAGGATATELCAARFSLFLAGSTNGEAHAPVFTAEFAAILEWTGSRKLQQQMLSDLLDDAQEDSCTAESALRTNVDMPKLPRLAIAQLLGGEWAQEPVRSLGSSATPSPCSTFSRSTRRTSGPTSTGTGCRSSRGRANARWRSSPRPRRAPAGSVAWRTSRPSLRTSGRSPGPLPSPTRSSSRTLARGATRRSSSWSATTFQAGNGAEVPPGVRPVQGPAAPSCLHDGARR